MRPLLSAAAACGVVLGGCLAPPRQMPPPPRSEVRFVDVAEEAGIDFRLGHGRKSPLNILETASGGAGFLDFDQDGDPDVILVGDRTCRLYRNLGRGRFQDASGILDLTRDQRWMGCAVGDYNGDRYPDVLLTGFRCAALLQNDRGRRFRDATRSSGIRTDLWTTSAEFADIDRDGDLDLYVGAYVAYHPGSADLCRLGTLLTACGPERYQAERGLLYRNEGHGRFEDATSAFGLEAAAGKTWGVAFGDYNGDGWPDLYLANDRVPSNLFRNDKGVFRDASLESGTAYDAAGGLMGAMGVDWGDADGDGGPDLFVTTYHQEASPLYVSPDGEAFKDVGERAGLASPTRPQVGFGCGFFDADNDGDLDLFAANGHVRDNVGALDAAQTYAQPMQLFLNDGFGRYRDVSAAAGADVSEPAVGRGVAFADYDGDGDADVLVVDLAGQARLLRNEYRGGNRWIKIRLRASGENAEALGARVTITTAGERRVRWAKRGGSVLSASDSAVHCGLGPATEASVEVEWPDGGRTVRRAVPANHSFVLSITNEKARSGSRN